MQSLDPYNINEVVQRLKVTVCQDRDDPELLCAYSSVLGLWGSARRTDPQAVYDLATTAQSLWDELSNTSDDRLTEDAKIMRDKLAEVFRYSVDLGWQT